MHLLITGRPKKIFGLHTGLMEQREKLIFGLIFLHGCKEEDMSSASVLSMQCTRDSDALLSVRSYYKVLLPMMCTCMQICLSMHITQLFHLKTTGGNLAPDQLASILSPFFFLSVFIHQNYCYIGSIRCVLVQKWVD